MRVPSEGVARPNICRGQKSLNVKNIIEKGLDTSFYEDLQKVQFMSNMQYAIFVIYFRGPGKEETVNYSNLKVVPKQIKQR